MITSHVKTAYSKLPKRREYKMHVVMPQHRLFVNRRLFTVETWFRSEVSPRRICGGKSDIGTSFSPSPSVSPCQYHSTAVPYSLMCQLRVGQGAR
jgi:hypothetical protein